MSRNSGSGQNNNAFSILARSVLSSRDLHPKLNNLAQLNDEVSKLQQKLDDARAKQKALLMRGKTVESRIKVKRQIQREALDGAFQRFEHFERRMDNLESQLESMDIGREVSPDLAAHITALEEDERISDELERLKSEMGDKQ